MMTKKELIYAKHFIDAFQSMRISLFGELLTADDDD